MEFQAKNTDEFIVEMQGKIRENPSADDHYNLGSAYVAKGRFVEAEGRVPPGRECFAHPVEAYVQQGGRP
jgi:hypothetical protein